MLILTNFQLVAAVKPSPLDQNLFVKGAAQEEIFRSQVADRWASRGYSVNYEQLLDEAQVNLGLDEPVGSEFLLNYGLAPIRRLASKYIAAGNAIDIDAGDGVSTWVFVNKHGVQKSFCFEPQDLSRTKLLRNVRR